MDRNQVYASQSTGLTEAGKVPEGEEVGQEVQGLPQQQGQQPSESREEEQEGEEQESATVFMPSSPRAEADEPESGIAEAVDGQNGNQDGNAKVGGTETPPVAQALSTSPQPQQQAKASATMPKEQSSMKANLSSTADPTKAATSVAPPTLAAETSATVKALAPYDFSTSVNGLQAAPTSSLRDGPEEYRASLRARIERERRDGDAWLALIEEASSRADLEGIRKIYEDFFVVFPNAARQWQDYASLELSHSEFSNVENIFTRCLRSTPSTELWRLYLSYTRRVNPVPPSSGGSGGNDERERVRKVIEGAYEFALKFIGQSRDAGEVWKEYIAFLKERETNNQWEAGQKMDDVRRTYQRAIAVPLSNVEQIWREYDAYENGLNRVTAKKFLAERSPAYMTARTVFREMKTLTDNLYRPVLAKVPCFAAAPKTMPLVTPGTIAQDRAQFDEWKRYLQWEESNPLQLEDAQVLYARVSMAYRKATMHMRFFPEVWYMAANHSASVGRLDEAASLLQQGMEACTGSFLLHFAFIEQAEARGQTTECGAIFTSLVDWVHAQIHGLEDALEEAIKAIDVEGERYKAEAEARRRDEGASDEIEGEEREEVRKMEEERERRRNEEREKVKPTVEELKESAALVWIKYMHFVRRTEGLRACRSIFGRARKSPLCTWQVFEANALMEYHCSKDVKVATKVFELALKSYGGDEAFVVRYLDFLISINDDNNARALFERTVHNFSPERARPIWERWYQFEYTFGDHASIAKIDARLKEIYPEEPPIDRFVERSRYMDIDVVSSRDLGYQPMLEGSNAAERAVAASRDMGARMEYASSSLPSTQLQPPTGPAADNYPASMSGPPLKRVRFNREGGSPTPPPPSGPSADAGDRRRQPAGFRRSASPPSRFVPPPREGNQPTPPQNHAPVRGPPPQQSVYLEIPEVVLHFMSILPMTAAFDGPRFQPEDIVECLVRSNLPMASGGFPQQQGNLPRPMRGGRRGGVRGGRRF